MRGAACLTRASDGLIVCTSMSVQSMADVNPCTRERVRVQSEPSSILQHTGMLRQGSNAARVALDCHDFPLHGGALAVARAVALTSSLNIPNRLQWNAYCSQEYLEVQQCAARLHRHAVLLQPWLTAASVTCTCLLIGSSTISAGVLSTHLWFSGSSSSCSGHLTQQLPPFLS
jgi:hypothetical protein